MSSVKRPGGSWIQLNFDKLVLVIALIVLLASAVTLVLRVNGQRAAVAEAPWEQPVGSAKGVDAIDTAVYKAAIDAVTKPFQVAPQQQRIAVGELRVSCVSCSKPIAFDATVCPFCRVAQPEIVDVEKFDGDQDGIPDMVEKQMGLNPLDPTDAQADADGDLFTNVEEVNGKTDLKDPASFPPPSAKSRLVTTFVNPFMLRFLGVQEVAAGDYRYQLNARTLDKTYFAKIGDEVEGYSVSAYDADAAEGPTLVLQQGPSSKPVRLVKGRIVQQDARTARLVSLLDGTFTNVQINSSLRIKDFEYKVVDIRDDRVVIRDTKSGAETTVVPLTEEEKLKLQGGGVSSPFGGTTATPGGVSR